MENPQKMWWGQKVSIIDMSPKMQDRRRVEVGSYRKVTKGDKFSTLIFGKLKHHPTRDAARHHLDKAADAKLKELKGPDQ